MKIAPALSLTRRGFDFPYSLFIPAQILRCCRLTHFFSPLPLTHLLTHTLTQNRSPACGTATSMWGMSCENRQPTPLERAQQACMLRLTTPHNPKVVGSNPAPATKDPRFYYLGFSLAFLWDNASISDQFGGICCVNSTVFLGKLIGKNHL